MRTMWTITKREYIHYFVSPMAYAVALMFLLILGLIFLIGVTQSAQPNATAAFGLSRHQGAMLSHLQGCISVPGSGSYDGGSCIARSDSWISARAAKTRSLQAGKQGFRVRDDCSVERGSASFPDSDGPMMSRSQLSLGICFAAMLTLGWISGCTTTRVTSKCLRLALNEERV